MAGEAAEVLLTPEAEETAADQVSAAYSYLAQKFKKEDDRRLLSATNQELSRYFLDDINRIAQNNRVVLCFDTYEQTSIFLDGWLRDLISAKFGEFSGRVMLVIAGRHPLGQPWTRFKRAINFVELEPFTEAEARKYLSDSNIADEDQVKELIRLSEGLPVLLALLTSTPGGLSTEVCESAVQRFLQDVLPEQREAALRACIPRYYNQDILGVILEPPQANAVFEWLTQTPFAKSKALGWTYHDRVRSLMQRYLSLRSPREWSNLHTKLADYHHQELQQHHSTWENKRYLDDQNWQYHFNEYLYHKLVTEPDEGLTILSDYFLQIIFDFAFDAVEDTKNQSEILSRQWLLILNQVYEETLVAVVEPWCKRFQAVVSVGSGDDNEPTLEEIEVFQNFLEVVLTLLTQK